MLTQDVTRLIPEGYVPLPHRVGGHAHVDGELGEDCNVRTYMYVVEISMGSDFVEKSQEVCCYTHGQAAYHKQSLLGA